MDKLNEKQIIYDLCSKKDELNLTWKDIQYKLREHGIYKSVDFIRHEWYGIVNKQIVDNKNVGCTILSLSDLHIPYQISLDEIVAKYKNKVDILVFNGDEQDCQSISSFPKMYRKSFIEELILTRKIIIDLIDKINAQIVVFIDGNHSKRTSNYFSKKLDSDIMELMPSSSLELIINTGFTRYNHETHTKEYFSPLREVLDEVEIVYDGSYYCQIGKTLFVHPYSFSSSILKTVEKCAIHFSRQQSSFDTIVMGHTHRLGFYKWGNINLFEQGCLCKQMDYTEGKLIQQSANGYMYIVQDKEGNLIYDMSKLEVI